MRKLIYTLSLLTAASLYCHAENTDSLPSWFSLSPEWRVGAKASASFVLPTNSFLDGDNPESKSINKNIAGSIRAGFSFNESSREGILYKGLYQGIGIGGNTFFAKSLVGSPMTAYVYQGAPVFNISDRLSINYEWNFGAAFGWKHYDEETPDNNAAVSTSVTAMMGLGFKLKYALSRNFNLSFGVEATHYSNGNTSWPNAGVNTVGLSVGFDYILNPQPKNSGKYEQLEEEADKGRWMYDVMVYGAWRKSVVSVGDPAEAQLCPGKFGVVGMQFSPMRKLNRWVAVAPSLDLQWDESAGIAPYWVKGTHDEYLKFERPPLGKQISLGISAHAELTMPIFSVNAGIGYEIINPVGYNRFYQSLTLKTFLTRHVYLNVGYRLGDFKNPQNLMLGIGVRF